jgi:hypothetical protein
MEERERSYSFALSRTALVTSSKYNMNKIALVKEELDGNGDEVKLSSQGRSSDG